MTMQELQDVEILLVEDNPNDAELAQRALKRERFANRLLVASDGAQALDYLFGTGAFSGRDVQNRPKVIFLDLKLPKIDGIEVLRKIKGDDRTRTIPVVVLTSSLEDRDVSDTYRLGVNSYIVKPVEFDRFFKTLGEMASYWLLLNQTPQ
jgi:CheY-like chemotaxis protein